MDAQSLQHLLAMLESDEASRQKLERAASHGESELLEAFRAFGSRAGCAVSDGEIKALFESSARLGKGTSSRELDERALDGVTGGTGDDEQLANVDLQNTLQKQQQTLQMMSNIHKMLYDSSSSIIRKIGS